MDRRILALLLIFVVGGCAPRSTGPGTPAYAYDDAVEVDNGAAFPVVIRYYRQHAGPFFLGTVGANENRRFVLPFPDVGHIFAETEAGRRLDHALGSNPVRIRRVPAETGG